VGLDLPGPVDPRRLLGLALTPGAFDGVAGMVHRALPDDAATDVSAPFAQPGRQ
jgi:predicted N-acetyltransferase YhbS